MALHSLEPRDPGEGARYLSTLPLLSPHPPGSLVADKKTSPADRSFQKTQATLVSSPNIVPDPGTRKGLDVRPRGQAAAEVP